MVEGKGDKVGWADCLPRGHGSHRNLSDHVHAFLPRSRVADLDLKRLHSNQCSRTFSRFSKTVGDAVGQLRDFSSERLPSLVTMTMPDGCRRGDNREIRKPQCRLKRRETVPLPDSSPARHFGGALERDRRRWNHLKRASRDKTNAWTMAGEPVRTCHARGEVVMLSRRMVHAVRELSTTMHVQAFVRLTRPSCAEEWSWTVSMQ
jgi:hypothetical protein